MGSFNTACFVTRQTITPGDEVVIQLRGEDPGMNAGDEISLTSYQI